MHVSMCIHYNAIDKGRGQDGSLITVCDPLFRLCIFDNDIVCTHTHIYIHANTQPCMRLGQCRIDC
jgi:hypothetical protein